MNQLWAPWRMAYLNQNEPVHGCIFCVKAHEDRDVENYVVFRSDQCFALLNLYPYNSGHLLVVPYHHTGDLALLKPDSLNDVMSSVQRSLRALGAAFHPEGFNIGINQGASAGAGIADHIHFHVVPRWGGDTNFMPVLSDVKVMPELLAATAAKLREAFLNLAAPEK